MRSAQLVSRNIKEVARDPLSIGLAIALPTALFVVLQSLAGDDVQILTPTSLAPGIALFGLAMLVFSASMTLAKDKETALLPRLLTCPLRASDFVAGYSLPYLPVAALQVTIIFALAAAFGLEMSGNVGFVILFMLLMAIFYIGVGMILGVLFSVGQVSAVWTGVLLLTIFGGTWMDLKEVGGAFETIAGLFPFAHALDATRAVMFDGVGFSDIATDLVWVTCYAIVSIVIAVWLFSRKMVE